LYQTDDAVKRGAIAEIARQCSGNDAPGLRRGPKTIATLPRRATFVAAGKRRRWAVAFGCEAGGQALTSGQALTI
jgi:hypothetical protein